MAAADFIAALPGLQVEQARLQGVGHLAPAVHPLVQVCLHQLEQEFVEDVGIPPAVHVALAQAE
ncbi:hypothetical protein D3C73_1530600 [compost metagenome]